MCEFENLYWNKHLIVNVIHLIVNDMKFRSLITLYHHHHHYIRINFTRRYTLYRSSHSEQFSLCQKITCDKIPKLARRISALTSLPKIQISLKSDPLVSAILLRRAFGIYWFINNVACQRATFYKLPTMSHPDIQGAFNLLFHNFIRISYRIF